MDPLQIFENFKLDTLDESWSDEVWNREFITFPEPPSEYSILLGSEDMEAQLKETCRTLKSWIIQNRSLDESNEEERTEVSWQTLTALNINLKGLLAVLGYLMKTGQAIGADEDSRQACLAAASLYFILLSIPGSSTFHGFHPHLYQRAIETLKLSDQLIVSKKNQRVTDLETLYGDRVEEMLPSERRTLVKGLNSVLFELITMLETFYMKYQMRSLEVTVMSLVEVTKLETEVNHYHLEQRKLKEASLTSLSFNAYAALHELCETRHGPPTDTIRLIMRYLMPHLIPNYLDLPSKAINVVWDIIITFLNKLLISKGSSAEVGFEILIAQLLVRCPDRSEPRQKLAAVICKLINICKDEVFLKCIENLVKFSHSQKIPYRIFAQEVIGKLLTDMSMDVSEDEIVTRQKIKVVLISTTLSRCNDVSSMVRGKAMSIVESIVNNDKLTVKDFLHLSEKDKPFPNMEILLEAIRADTNPLPGPDTFNSMLLNKMKDERALVRKSAIHALQSLLTHFPNLLNKVAPIIGLHCRDTALTVRRDAIQALAVLLEKNPDSEILLKEYVKACLPRIYDVETKVQERVLETLQNLVLDKIQPFTESTKEGEQNNLPWKIISLLTKEKMRKNLSKVCDLWVKNGVITNSLISKVQLHIGTDHDIETWILISSLADHTKLTNMKKYFEDYKEIIRGSGFLMTLKLEVLRQTWHGMGREYLKDLQETIYECLCKFRISVECISVCIDILGGITKRLNASSGKDLLHAQAVEMMKSSENHIEQLGEEERNISEEAIDMYMKAMVTLGHASFFCTESVSEPVISVVQGLLLDCNSISVAPRLKAASIVLLGQQAMRDREVAENVMPILGRIMCSSDSAEAGIRINAVKALADICIRFTALVEPYLPDMCMCMKDSDVKVREAIIVIFVQLLLEDFIKVKGSFFYHILTMLSDKDETIRELTIFLVKQRLLAKNKTLMSQSFVRSIFHYNDCQTKNKFNDRKIKKKEKDTLLLIGMKKQSERKVIYDFMMEHLDPPSKLKILTKLNSEVLEGICEKYINVKKIEGTCVLKDVLYIISSERMSATYGSKMQDDEFNQEEGVTEIEARTNKAISVIVDGMKKFKMNVMLQTLIKLRQFLSECKSPLLIDVSKFFIRFISDMNKDQVGEILDEYPQLKKNLEQDISKYGKKPDVNNSESEEEEPAVDKNVMEVSESASTKKKDINANVSKKNVSELKTPTTTPRKIKDVQLVPKIVLRRLSTLTYPGVKEWKSPPRESNSSYSSDPGPSSSGISSASKTPTDDTFSDFSESESSSLPKPKKIARLSDDIRELRIISAVQTS